MVPSSSSSSSTSVPPLIKGGGPIKWSELPPELTSLILHRLGAVEILVSAQKVCRSWHRVAKDLDPSLWRKIDLQSLSNRGFIDVDYDSNCRRAVDLSEGGLVEINITNVRSDCESLLAYITDRFNFILDNCPHLEHLDLRKCFNIELVGDLEKRCLERIKDLRRPRDSTDDNPF